MRCPKCGKEYMEGLNYCIYCDGAAQEAENPREETPESGEFKEKLEQQTKRAEQEKAKQAENLKTTINTYVESIKKHKVLAASVSGLILVVLTVFLCFQFVPFFRVPYLNMCGNKALSQDLEKARGYFSESRLMKDNCGANVGLVRYYMEKEYYDKAFLLFETTKIRFGEDEEIQKLIQDYAPKAPKVNLESGTYEKVQRVHWEKGDFQNEEAVVYYSLNGGEKQEYVQGEELVLNQKREYKLETWTENPYLRVEGEHQSYTYIMNIPIPQTVTANLPEGVYTTDQSVELCSPDGYDVFYTTDGKDPNEKAQKYRQPISLSDGTTLLKAVAIDEDGVAGEIFTAKYVLELPVPEMVSVSLPGGVYHQLQTVELSASGENKIYYTLDGGHPSVTSANTFLYEGPISLDFGKTTLVAVAVNEYGKESNEVSAVYHISYVKYGPGYSNFLSTAVGEFTSGGENIFLYSKDMKEKEVFAENASTNLLRSDEEYLYFIEQSDGSIHRICLDERRQNEQISQAKARSIEILPDNIYFVGKDDSFLYRINKDGGDLTLVYKEPVDYIQRVGDSLYFSSGTIKHIDGNGGAVEEMENSPATVEYFSLDEDGTLFYVLDGKLYNRKGSQELILLEEKESSWETQASLFNEGERHHVSEKIDAATMMVCNRSLYVRVTRISNVDYYSAWTQSVTDSDAQVECTWYKIGLDDNQITQLNNKSDFLHATDRFLVDNSGNITEVIH